MTSLSSRTGFLDWVPKKMQRVGCVELLNTVQRRVQPRLHVFGHIHEGEWADGEGTPTGVLLTGPSEGFLVFLKSRSPAPSLTSAGSSLRLRPMRGLPHRLAALGSVDMLASRRRTHWRVRDGHTVGRWLTVVTTHTATQPIHAHLLSPQALVLEPNLNY